MKEKDPMRTGWQLAALSGDVKKKPVARTIADTPIVLFRHEGAVSALQDRCPHRNHPLSLGRMVDGSIQCPYHGWRFAPDGACVEVPGCQLGEVSEKRLSATPVAVHEAHGAIFVRLDDGPEAAREPELRAPFGLKGHDHFWWDQGEWRGTAFDAIENVLDPFHTSELHHGFIRRRDQRIAVKLKVENFERGIEMTIDQSRPDTGLMSRMLERNRTRSRTRYDAPTSVQAIWEGQDRLTLCVTAFFTPVTSRSFRPFACFTTPKGLLPGWVKTLGIKAFLLPVVSQDRKALAAMADVVERFGTTRYVQGPGDILGGRVHQIYRGLTLEPGVTETVSAEL